ncbi:50S ribosomal protein L4 [Blattabacterium cuenoti]|uniref:50S ribosomal protein L4 n=1 Tax=Blattabacterium cuenoti TaxID=1653831 RepID=UPI00163C9F13|nr:50S ribosomal protein L4 [Blattabacterium cuenoti]
MKLQILNIQGNFTKKVIEFNDSLFSKKNYDHSIYLEIKRYLLAQRQGTHKSKERGDISGSNRKLHRQKGTGGSRKGSIKNPIFRGGGRIFGPKPRNYIIKINKKTKHLVKKSIIEYKLKKNKIKIIEDIQLNSPKTKLFVNILKSLKLMNKKSLIVVEKLNNNLYLSSRNLKKIKLLTISELNSYFLLNYLYIIFTESSVKMIHKLFY